MSRSIGTLNLQVAPRAKKQIAQLLERGGETECWPALMLGVHVGESIGYWTVVRYVAENVDGLAPLYDEKGIPLLYECHGLILAIPQTNLLPRFNGATLDFEEGKYVLDGTNSDRDI